jgi:FkbM family methyltransferase
MLRPLFNIIHKIENRIYPLKPINYKISYSQCGEDLIIDYVFKIRKIHNPSYLDIGANHPFHLSNTALFYNRGNIGVNIEANPSLIADFFQNRPNDINLNIGIGLLDEQLDFYVMEDHTLSTFSKNEMESMVKFDKNLKEITPIKVVTIKTILEAHFSNSPPDLLSIDVEGLDFQILASIDYNRYAPKIICVEAAEYSPIGSGVRRNELIDFLKEQGYYEYANTNLNAIMVLKHFWFI